MKTSTLALIVIGIVIIVSFVAVWFSPSIQDFMASNTMWNGIRNFNDKFKAVNLDSLDDLADRTGKNVLLSIPYQTYSPEELELLKQFVEKGNTLILMDDFGFGNDILKSLGAQSTFDHNLLLDPLLCYKNALLPRITNFSPEVKAAGIKALAFNHGTVLSHIALANVIAWSSSDSFLDYNRNGVQDRDEPQGPFAVAAELRVGRGNVIVVCDPSLIINTMVDRNDNQQFMQYLLGRSGQADSILLDRAHLSKSPLDTSKINLEAVRKIMSNPYLLVGLMAVVFILVIRYTLRKGELFG